MTLQQHIESEYEALLRHQVQQPKERLGKVDKTSTRMHCWERTWRGKLGILDKSLLDRLWRK